MKDPLKKTRPSALILGATGAFGAALTRCLSESGWEVRAVSRREINNADQSLDPEETLCRQVPIRWVSASLDNPDSLEQVALGIDVIVHAVNVPYPKWDPLMVEYTGVIIELARRASAQILFVGNIYNAGIPTGGIITDTTEDSPVSEKGQLRARLEEMMRLAAESGVKVTIMRLGDFFGPGIKTYNWFNETTKVLAKNKLSIAGAPELAHSWAYLPDAAKTTEQVLRLRLGGKSSSQFVVLPFAGHVFTFDQLRVILEDLTGSSIKFDKLPWPILRMLGLVWPTLRDVVSMRYLWQHDIRLSNEALSRFLGHSPKQTSLEAAVRTTLVANGHQSLLVK